MRTLTSASPDRYLARRWPAASALLLVGRGQDGYRGLAAAAALRELGVDVTCVLSPASPSGLGADAFQALGSRTAKPDGVRARLAGGPSWLVAVAAPPDDPLALDAVRRAGPTTPTVLVRPVDSARSRLVVVPDADRERDGCLVLTPDPAWEGDDEYLGTVLQAMRAAAGRLRGDLVGRTLVVTAGGTREPLDPVRFLTNRSSGKMGLALAEAARDRGARVVLVSASRTPAPLGVETVDVDTVADLRAAVLTACAGPRVDAVIMAAAVSDFRPRERSAQKIKKGPAAPRLELEVIPNFVPEIPAGVLRVGFAAETQDVERIAAAKMHERGFDMICANDVSRSDIGFESDRNQLTIFSRTGPVGRTGVVPKYEAAHVVLDAVRDGLRAG